MLWCTESFTASQHLMTLHRYHSKAPVGFFRRAFFIRCQTAARCPVSVDWVA
jgi:hypothetical protein